MEIKMNLNVLKLLTLSPLLFSLQSYASVYTQCNSCNTYNSFKNIAEYTDDTKGDGSGIVFVANHVSGVLKKYAIIKEKEPGLPLLNIVRELNLSSREIQGFQKIRTARQAVINEVESLGDVPTDIATSAYDLAGASYVLNNVSDHYTKTASFTDKVGAYISSLGVVTGKVSNVPIVVVLTFSDGSIGEFKITPTIGDSIHISIISLIDGDNNTIPLTASGYQSGSYNFTKQGQNGVDSFISAAERHGVFITNTSGGGSTSTGQSMSCKTEGDSTTCIIKRDN
jgi:hypothetical protein